MKFEENPFRVLQVSIYAAKSTIIERADDLSFADTDSEDVINQARDILLNPKKRIAAEMRWFIGCSPAKELKYVADCLSEAAPVDDDDYEDYSALAELNFQIYKLDGKSSDLDGCIAYMDGLYAELNAEEIREQINAARAKSKFPAVKDTVAIKSEPPFKTFSRQWSTANASNLQRSLPSISTNTPTISELSPKIFSTATKWR